MNPLLPETVFVPDAEARIMHDGRLYLYGSFDLAGSNTYCSHELHLFSTDDMEQFTDHGCIFRNDGDAAGVRGHETAVLFAPDAIEKDGKTYLYLCGVDHTGPFEAVSVADSPTGPFAPATPLNFADGTGIDPTVFVDDDGRGYYFWGQFSLMGARLKDSMTELDETSVVKGLLTETEHGFHEGASIRKRGDKYYMVYTDISRGRATCLSYAVADAPLGPYTKKGVIIDNTYCDPQSWNNHGSIAEYNGQWYVFYHRSSNNSVVCRRVCAEPIFFDENGNIGEVPQTSNGSSAPLDATASVRAYRACRMMNEVYLAPVGGEMVLRYNGTDHFGGVSDWAEYRTLDFGDGVRQLAVTVKGKGKIEAKIEGGETVAFGEFDRSEFGVVTVSCRPISGVHTLWLHFCGGSFELKEFRFS